MWMMPSYKIHRLKDSQFQQFRWAPHTAGASQARPKDYALAGTLEAASAYAAWSMLKDSVEALRVGDILESEDGGLRICKYVGFEEAQWFVPEPKPGLVEVQKADPIG
jgi:hypothetical protein